MVSNLLVETVTSHDICLFLRPEVEKDDVIGIDIAVDNVLLVFADCYLIYFVLNLFSDLCNQKQVKNDLVNDTVYLSLIHIISIQVDQNIISKKSKSTLYNCE